MPRLSELQAITVADEASRAERLTEALQQLAQDLEEAIAQAFQAMLAEAMASAFWPLLRLREEFELLERAADDPQAAEQLLERLRVDQGVFARYSNDPLVVRAALVLAIREVAAQWHERQLVWVPWEGRISKVGKVRPGVLPLPCFWDWLVWRTTQRAIWWLKGWAALDIEVDWVRHEQLQDIVADQVSVEDLAIRAVDAEWLLENVWQVASPTQRKIIALLWDGLAIDEIAGVLQVAPETVRVQLHRLRRKFPAHM